MPPIQFLTISPQWGPSTRLITLVDSFKASPVVQTYRQHLPPAEIGTAQQEIPVIKIYCVSYAYSGVWAFSPKALRAFAPTYMLERSEYSDGEIWEADLEDLNGNLWSFSSVC